MGIVLHQFAFSHFNEKARWALAYKGIEHERETYLPGPHMGPIKRMTAQTATPVLDLDGKFVAGSAQILQRLEAQFPQPALLPEDVDEQSAALQWQSRLDERLGPATRTLVFNVLVHELGYLARMFGSQCGRLKRLGYRAMLPAVRPLMKQGNGVTPENVETARTIVRESLDEITQASANSGFLVGRQFTLADLTAAALLAPLMSVSHPDMARPQPTPAAVAALLDDYAHEPAVHWARDLYEKWR